MCFFNFIILSTVSSTGKSSYNIAIVGILFTLNDGSGLMRDIVNVAV